MLILMRKLKPLGETTAAKMRSTKCRVHTRHLQMRNAICNCIGSGAVSSASVWQGDHAFNSLLPKFLCKQGNSGACFRSTDFWVMTQHANRCAAPLEPGGHTKANSQNIKPPHRHQVDTMTISGSTSYAFTTAPHRIFSRSRGPKTRFDTFSGLLRLGKSSLVGKLFMSKSIV